MPPKDYTVISANHTGTVASLEQSLKFWQDIIGGKVLYKSQFSKPPYSTIVGIREAVFDIALLALRSSHVVDLLECSKPEAAALIGEPELLGWKALSDGPQAMTRVDGSRWTAVYMYGPDGETVEL